jgi:cytochrome b6-f complex iron-sulfur subunit
MKVSSLGLAWAAFTAAMGACTAGMGRFFFPNVLYEPPASFKAGAPTEYGPGVDERWKARHGVWVVRNAEGFYAIKSVCTHLGCTPNWLSAEQKFKCPCHGSGFYPTGINFEGPAPRPLERYRIYLSDDGQIVVDRSRIFQQEKGQWSDSDSFLKYTATV